VAFFNFQDGEINYFAAKVWEGLAENWGPVLPAPA